MIKIAKQEIYRYLGCRGQVPDEAVVREVDRCLEELQGAVTPRYIFRRYTIERASCTCGEKRSAEAPEEIPILRIAGMEIRSRSLSRSLRGCESAFLMGATLGLGPDRLIARASVSRMSRAVILQAAAAAMIEAWCDHVNRKMIEEAAEESLFCRPRFSPGYGDFSLEFQRDLTRILHLQKEIGVSLTQSLLMMPSKSVTAVIGLSGEDSACLVHGCEECGKAPECAFSRNG